MAAALEAAQQQATEAQRSAAATGQEAAQLRGQLQQAAGDRHRLEVTLQVGVKRTGQMPPYDASCWIRCLMPEWHLP